MATLSVEETAKILVKAHQEQEPKTREAYLFTSDDEVRLLEISDAYVDIDEVLPFRFGAHPTEGILYPSVIITLGKKDWEGVEKGRLALPSGWDLKTKKRLL